MSNVIATKYDLIRYTDAQVIGHANLTSEQVAHYESMSDGPECLIRLGALPHDFYEIDAEYQDTAADTTVWIDC